MDNPTIGKSLVVWVGLSTDAKPAKAVSRQQAIETDTNDVYEWFGNIDGLGAWVQIVENGRTITHDKNPHEVVVNEHFHLHTAVTDTLAVAAAAGDTSITVADAAGFVVGGELQIENGVIEVTFATITVIAGTLFTLDRPLDQNFEIGDTVTVVETDMSTTAGTLASPISYKVEPTPGEEWAIARILVTMVMLGAGDDSKFGDLTALTNGCTLRYYDGTNNQFTTFTNWKINSDIIHDGYDATYNNKAGGGNFGFVSRWTFERIGVEPKIHGDHGDYLEFLIQDDITGLVNFQVKAQGFVDD